MAGTEILEGGGRGELYLTLNHLNDSYIQAGSSLSHFSVLFLAEEQLADLEDAVSTYISAAGPSAHHARTAPCNGERKWGGRWCGQMVKMVG